MLLKTDAKLDIDLPGELACFHTLMIRSLSFSFKISTKVIFLHAQFYKISYLPLFYDFIQKILVINREGKRQFARSRSRKDKGNIKMNLYKCYNVYKKSRGSAVGIVTGYGLDDLGVRVRVPVGSRIFTSPYHPGWLRSPPNLLSNGYRGAPSPGVKRLGCEADHSPPTSVKVKKTWIYTFTPPYIFMT
jgi:hypothetical protein